MKLLRSRSFAIHLSLIPFIAFFPQLVEAQTFNRDDISTNASVVLTEDSNDVGQVTSVSQLSDLQPTDWAFQALQSLVERYGCVSGYLDGTFRGNRAATRYEMAAVLNACLDQLGDRFADQADLEVLQALQEEFRPELGVIGGRIDSLEERTSTLEAQQFSTTTKLQGEAIVSGVFAGGGASTGLATALNNNLGGPLGTTFNDTEPNPIVNYRVRLNFATSFTGKDTLITGLQAFGSQGALLGGGSVQNALIPGSILDAGSATNSTSPQFAGFDPQNLASGANEPGNVQLYKLLYVFPVTEKVTAFVFPQAETTDAFPKIIPWASEGQGALSRFAGLNPVVRQSGGTSGVGVASGAGVIWNPDDKVNLTALYASVAGSQPTGDVSTGNLLGSGFLPSEDTSFIGSAQLTVKPTSKLDAALNVAYAQHNLNILGTGLASPGAGGALGFGGGDVFALPGVDLGQRVEVVGLGGTATYRLSSKVSLSAFAAGFFVDNAAGGIELVPALGGQQVETNTDANAVYTSFLGGIHFQDLFAEGNTAAIIAGQPLHLESTGGAATISPAVPNVFEFARPLHLEAFYRFQVNDGVSVTPGVFAVINPESNSENDAAVVGIVRTTFSF